MTATLSSKQRLPNKASQRSPYVKLAPRSCAELYALPPSAMLTPPEAAMITRLSEGSLAARRSYGMWPPYHRLGKSVRYRLGELLELPSNPTRGQGSTQQAA